MTGPTPPDAAPTLRTARLTLRPFRDDDLAEIYALVYADQAVREPWSGFTGTLADLRARFAAEPVWRLEGGFGYFAVTRTADAALLGLMGFQPYGDEPTDWLVLPAGVPAVGPRDAELTYALGRAFWRQGYALEAARALIPDGFSRLGIERVVNAISPTNAASRGLMERLGFTFLDNGNPEDVIGVLERPAGAGGGGLSDTHA